MRTLGLPQGWEGTSTPPLPTLIPYPSSLRRDVPSDLPERLLQDRADENGPFLMAKPYGTDLEFHLFLRHQLRVALRGREDAPAVGGDGDAARAGRVGHAACSVGATLFLIFSCRCLLNEVRSII